MFFGSLFGLILLMDLCCSICKKLRFLSLFGLILFMDLCCSICKDVAVDFLVILQFFGFDSANSREVNIQNVILISKDE